MSRGQAVIMDALIFLMICGFASAALLWAGSVYGSKAFEAYKYMYLNDYETTSLAVLTTMEYNDAAGVSRTWLNEVGDFMKGRFNETDPPGRFSLMLERWKELCDQSPTPMLFIIYTEETGVKHGNQTSPIYFACGDLLFEDAGKNGMVWYEGRTRPGKMGLLWEEDPYLNRMFVNPTKYPYYSSPVETKACFDVNCKVEMKIYY